ncbi:hypothetical protein [Rhizobium sp. BK176]|uniref:hypothetical protein n=1 Tax=Rhizobium sp. BK176 TaxID=2587071 RepID=UPI00216911AC|nr:hypothetical protein [Rhizobium sp. BK176]MCS4089956.1 hypothetical protein [Rhizobium sp. BK176]
MPAENEVAEPTSRSLSGPISADPGCITVIAAGGEDRLVAYLADFFAKAQIEQNGPSTVVFGPGALLRKIEAALPDGTAPRLWMAETPEENRPIDTASKDKVLVGMWRHDSSLNVFHRLLGDDSCFTAKDLHAQAAVGKHVAGGVIASTVDALFGKIASELLSDPAADVQWLVLDGTPRLHVYFEGNTVTEDFRKWWKSPDVQTTVTTRLDIPDGPILFGLEAQGHIPTVEAALNEGVDWKEIGRRIGWDGETARTYYDRHLARKQADNNSASEDRHRD